MPLPTKTAPPIRAQQGGHTAIVWCNIGSPDAPTAGAVRRFLAEFLSDPHIIELPRLLWWPILHGIVLRIRPAKSAQKYAQIWTDAGSPLHIWSEKQAKLLQGWLGYHNHAVQVRAAMRYGQPAIAQTLQQLHQQGFRRILVLPAYPQYSCTTTTSAFGRVFAWSSRCRNMPELRFVKSYHDHPLYIQALANNIRQHWRKHGRSRVLVMSFHGTPDRTRQKGDPYAAQCHTTAQLLAQALGLEQQQYRLTFQSRFGPVQWLQPYTDPTLQQLARQGTSSVDVVCPGFVSDCLETLEEISQQAQQVFMAAGGKSLRYIACLNDNPDWIAALGQISLQHLAGWDTQYPPCVNADCIGAGTGNATATTPANTRHGASA